MSKRPSYEYFFKDFMSATFAWSDSEVGAYQRALNFQADTGPLLEKDLKKILGEHWDRVSGKFARNTLGLYYNRRMKEVCDKRKKFLEGQVKKGLMRWKNEGKPLSGKVITKIAEHITRDLKPLKTDGKPLSGKRVTKIAKPFGRYKQKINIAISDDKSLNENGVTKIAEHIEADKPDVLIVSNGKYLYMSEELKSKIISTGSSALITDAKLRSWANDFRLMIECDKRTEQQVLDKIEEVFNDIFWKSVIRSAGTLRLRWNEGKLDRLGESRVQGYSQPVRKASTDRERERGHYTEGTQLKFL